MQKTLEEALAYHCAPALVGLKPANLISCDRRQYPQLDEQIALLNQKLNRKGLFFRPVCACGTRTLLLVYRRQVLARHLTDPDVAMYLHEAGYPKAGMEELLAHLQLRLAQSPDFPHEVGLILGYPLADVRGFLQNQGKNCRLSGYWKVYENEAEASMLFSQYDRCRKTLCNLVANGISIPALFHAA